MSALPDLYGASVTLAATRQLKTLSATSQTVNDMDPTRIEARRGPCVEASATGIVQHAVGAVATERWPEFGAASAAQGIASVLSTPLTISERTIGALNLYGLAEDTLESLRPGWRPAFARHAAAVLSNAVSIADAEATNRNLAEALATARSSVKPWASSSPERCSTDRAFEVLRLASQRTNRKVREIAEQIVHSTELEAPGDDA